MSSDFCLITRLRPDAWAFARTVSEAAGREVDIAGDFGDPDDYLNVSAVDGLWIEVEPPGHVEYGDLRKMYPGGVRRPPRARRRGLPVVHHRQRSGGGVGRRGRRDPGDLPALGSRA